MTNLSNPIQTKPVLTVTGLWNSGSNHWQTHWERKYPHWVRVQQADWEHPVNPEWVLVLEQAIAQCEHPPFLVAHSLGCIVVVHWAQMTNRSPIAGAFLVAPSDVEARAYPLEAMGFSPIPMRVLPFPSMIVASSNDKYLSSARAEAFAAAWGSRLLSIGEAGHIHGASGYGPWPEGEQMFLEFMESNGG